MTPTPVARILLWAWTVLVCIFIVGPLLVMIAISLTSLGYISLPYEGVSLRWYRELLGHPEFLAAGRASVLLAVESTALAVLLATPVAMALTRFRFRGRAIVMLISNSPLFIPLVMTGLSILIFFSSWKVGSPAFRLFVGHVSLTVPYIIRMTSTSMTGFDWNQESAALNLGASRLRAFIEIVLPQIMPGVVAGSLFALIVSFDNVGLSIFLSGATFTTLPVELFSYATYDLTPMVAAASTVMILFSALLIMLIEWTVGVQRVLSGEARAAVAPAQTRSTA
jgi:putative spermidine/putrescine transport system permease protein